MDNEFTVDLDVVDYKISLDSNNKIYCIRSRNRRFEYFRENADFSLSHLKDALRILFLYEPERFKELYGKLIENDPEMAPYAEACSK